MISEIYQYIGFITSFFISVIAIHILFIWWIRGLRTTEGKTPLLVRVSYVMMIVFFIFITPMSIFHKKFSQFSNIVLVYIDVIFVFYILVLFYFVFFLILKKVILFFWKKISLHSFEKNYKISKIYIFYIGISIAFVASAFGLWNKGNIKIMQYQIYTEHPATKPIQIALLSDTHLGKKHNAELLDTWLEKVARLKPDYVLIAGDLVDMSIEHTDKAMISKVLEKYSKNLKIITILGNHDLFDVKNLPALIDTFQKGGATMLVDESYCPTKEICFFGRMDNGSKRKSFERKTIAELLPDTKPANQKWILIEHKPSKKEDLLNNTNLDLVVAGHTHNGQIFPGNIFVRYIYDFSYGVYQFYKISIVITSGIGGVESFPFRIASQNEIVMISLY